MPKAINSTPLVFSPFKSFFPELCQYVLSTLIDVQVRMLHACNFQSIVSAVILVFQATCLQVFLL